MVLRGITYEAPSYLPLPPFRARLCSPHTSILSHRLSPSQFPPSVCSLLSFPPHLVLSPFFPPHLVHIHRLLSTTTTTTTSPLCPPHFPDLVPSLAPFHRHTRLWQDSHQRGTRAAPMQRAEPSETPL